MVVRGGGISILWAKRLEKETVFFISLASRFLLFGVAAMHGTSDGDESFLLIATVAGMAASK